MRITPFHTPIDFRGATDHARGKGHHLSGILRVAALATGALDKKYAAPDEDLSALALRIPATEVQTNGRLMRAILGFAWEDYIAKQLKKIGVEHQPGEMCHQGIYMNPDGVGCDDIGYLLHEIKFTFKSSKRLIQDETMWIWQCCGYLKAMEELYGEFCNRAVIHPMHVKGDYKGIDPVYRPVMLEFTKDEIDGVWSMVEEYRDLATPEGAAIEQDAAVVEAGLTALGVTA